MQILKYLSLAVSFTFFLILVISLVASDQSTGDMPREMKYLLYYLLSSIAIFGFISNLASKHQHANVLAMLGVYAVVYALTIHVGVMPLSTIKGNLSIVVVFSIITIISFSFKKGDKKW